MVPNLAARQDLYRRVGVAVTGWQNFVFDLLRLPSPARILEVGCGRGDLWVDNRSRLPGGWEVILSDLSPGMVQETRERLGAGSQFHLVVAELGSLPFRAASFDGVIANHMLYHLADLDVGLSDLHRVLARSGLLIAATNGPHHLGQLDQLAARLGLPVGPRSHPRTAFDLVTGPERIRPWFGQLTVARHPEEIRVTDPEPLIAYLRSLPGPRLGARRASAARRFLAAEIERRGFWRIGVDAGVIRGRRRARPLRSA
ncbi:MAG: class I SAM-dependent methyltransferase [Candidatus Dormibacteria bacterium]